MTWFRVDDQLPQHQKLDGLGRDKLACAMGIWALCGADCAARGTDGFVSHERLARLFGGVSASMTAAVEALVARGFWDVVDGGWQFHDWHDYQPTAAEVAEKRRDAARRQRDRRAKAGRGHTPVTRDVARDVPCDSRGTYDVTSRVVTHLSPARAPARVPDPDPTRPDPVCVSAVTPAQASPPAPSTRTQAAAPESPERAAVIAELRRHRSLACLDHERLADGVLSTQVSRPVPIAWLVLAIAQAAGAIEAEEAGGSTLPPAARAKLVVAYCRNAKGPVSGAAEPDQAALKVRRSTRLEHVEAAPPPADLLAAAGLKRGAS